MADIGHPTPPLHYADWKRGLHDVAIVLQRVMQGKLNNGGSVTLTTSSTTTTVTDARVGANSKISLTATDALAAAEIGGTAFYVSSKGIGIFVITHVSSGDTRTFDYLIGG